MWRELPIHDMKCEFINSFSHWEKKKKQRLTKQKKSSFAEVKAGRPGKIVGKQDFFDDI